jgi:hypothetical protein
MSREDPVDRIRRWRRGSDAHLGPMRLRLFGAGHTIHRLDKDPPPAGQGQP